MAATQLVGWHRLPSDMAVHPLHRISSREGKPPRQHFVEGDTQGIEITAEFTERFILPVCSGAM